MNIFIDTETTGLLHENCRIVSICWIVCQHDKIIDQSYFLVKPDGFKIPAKSTAIHGITQTEAENKGYSVKLILTKFEKALESCKSIVAHNVDFDVAVILKECQLYNLSSLSELIDNRHAICTMRKGMEVMNKKKWPKLADLYAYLYGEPITNAHNALSDTLHCLKCYLKMFPKDPSIFFFQDKFVTLTSEQQSIVYEAHDKHMQVVAGPGSGKTLTTLTRVKHLLDTEACAAEQIILTTFTCDAANELKNRLYDMLGYKPAVRIGTIDSISKYFLGANSQMKHVSEYSYEFLEKIDTFNLGNYKYLFVDEFQDINQVQFDIISHFYKIGVVLYVVGDDAQNIYSFRGSDVKYMIEFNSHFPTASRYFLTHNFRSCKQIVDFSNCSLEKHQYKIPKTMISNKQGEKPKIHYCVNSRQQAVFIVKKIKHYFRQGQTDIAVLCPLSQPLYLIEELLTKENVPNICLEGKHETRVHRKKGFVCLSTIHKSKGLEWDTVFLVHMDDEIIPRVKSSKELEDARRVFYVGITRPKNNLFITYTKSPSRYLIELSSDLYDSNKELLSNLKASSSAASTNYDDKRYDVDAVVLIASLEKSTSVIKHVRTNLFPSVTEKLKQYSTACSYGDYVVKENLKSEFNDVLKLMILNKIKPVDLSELLAYIILDPKKYSAYKKGDNIFVKNEIEEIAREFDIPVDRVKIYCREDNDPYVRAKMETEISRFSQSEDDLFSKFKAAWNIVLYNRVITEGRRKHLFKDYDYAALYDEFTIVYEKCVSELIPCDTMVKIQKKHIYDTVEIVGDDSIGTVICTANIEFGVLVRLFMQSYALNKNRIWILNPLTCIIREYKLENNAHSLVEYLTSQEIM